MLQRDAFLGINIRKQTALIFKPTAHYDLPICFNPQKHRQPTGARLFRRLLETLAVLLVVLVNGRTVNLGHLASQFPGAALHASNYRRLQRFFQFVRLDGDITARLIVGMLKLRGPKLLVLDRTNWKLGQSY